MLQVVAGIIELDGFILLCQRHAKENHFPLKWEFPGGKVEIDETPQNAIIRELHEELGIIVSKIRLFTEYVFQYKNEAPIQLLFYCIDDYQLTVQNRQFEKIAWVTRDKFQVYDILEGDKQVQRLLETGSDQ